MRDDALHKIACRAAAKLVARTNHPPKPMDWLRLSDEQEFIHSFWRKHPDRLIPPTGDLVFRLDGKNVVKVGYEVVSHTKQLAEIILRTNGKACSKFAVNEGRGWQLLDGSRDSKRKVEAIMTMAKLEAL